MKKQFYTIVIFPGSTGAPKEFRVSRRLVTGFFLSIFLILLGAGGGVYYYSQEFRHLLSNQTEMADLKRQAKIQKVQVEKFSQEIKNFENEMARLERFEKKLRVITALENSQASQDQEWGVGGPYGLTTNSFTTALEKGGQTVLERLSGDLAQLKNQTKLKMISLQELDEFFKNQSSSLASTPSIWPTRGWVTSGFGYRKSPFTSKREKHEGWDIAARYGSPIRVTADGVVVVEGKDRGYGKMIEVDHGYGIVTRYGHNSKHLVKVGDKVRRGQVIARVGSTGRSTGPHVHYEVIVGGVPVSPKNYILED